VRSIGHIQFKVYDRTYRMSNDIMVLSRKTARRIQLILWFILRRYITTRFKSTSI